MTLKYCTVFMKTDKEDANVRVCVYIHVLTYIMSKAHVYMQE